MMKKQLLLSTLALAVGISATSYLYLQKKESKSYTERIEKSADEEAFFPTYYYKDENGEVNPAKRIEILNKIRHRASRASALGLDIVFRGPDNVGGRTRAILELYGAPDTLLAGGVTGGLFVSYNGGATWMPHAQFQNQDSNTSIISSLFQDTLTGTIYVGSGSSFDAGGNSGMSVPGFGMYRSTDNGQTFTHITSTTPMDQFGGGNDFGGNFGESWLAINRIAVATNGDIYAATHRGLQVSRDNGETWENPIYVDDNFTIPNNGVCNDVKTTKSGKVVVSFGNSVYISETGEDQTFIEVNDNGLPTSGSQRTVVDVYQNDDDIIYVAFTSSGESSLLGVWKTTNGGETWNRVLVPFDDFSPYCSAAQCQGDYDACIAVSPTDPDVIFIGGVEIWRYDGSLTRVASEFGSPPLSDVLPFYVHADKHYFHFSPNNPNRLYVTTDGGISMTMNKGETWQGLNKGYTTTQFYGIAFAPYGGVLLGGTQDNGSLAILNDNLNDPNYAVQASGGDGFDAAISQIGGFYFTTSQYGVLYRGEQGLPGALISDQDRSSPFWTIVKLWEKTDDKTSKDSIVFNNDSIEQSIDVSNGAVRSYQATIDPIQPAARVLKRSIRVYSGDQYFSNANTESETELLGDGDGSVVFEEDGSFTVDVTFDEAPSENSNIFVQYAVSYKANDVLIIESENLNANLAEFTFEHRLENALNPGDQLLIQDPVQSLVAKSIAGGVGFYRDLLNIQATPELIEVTQVPGDVNVVEFTPDGDVAYIGAGNSVVRVSNLNELYTDEDVSKLVVTNLFNANFGWVSGISIDPTDDSRIVVSVANYGGTANVVEITDAKTGSGIERNIHGDLPPFPVFDVEIDMHDPNLIVAGTEFGIWATSDASGTSVSWTDENNELTYVPTFDVRQQQLPFDQASNSGMYYFGTYGRGIWETGTLVGIREFTDFAASEDAISDFKVYPNPISDVGTIEYTTSFNGNVDIRIFDINGRMVNSWQQISTNGKNRMDFNVSQMRSGAYFVTIDANGKTESAKFMVMK